MYKHNSYGPRFGSGHDLILADGCRGNTSSCCNKSSYNIGNNNLLDSKSSTSFHVILI